jgi:hypothetical protein
MECDIIHGIHIKLAKVIKLSMRMDMIIIHLTFPCWTNDKVDEAGSTRPAI